MLSGILPDDYVLCVYLKRLFVMLTIWLILPRNKTRPHED